MRLGCASAPSSGDTGIASLRGDQLRDAYLHHLTATGRGNLSYERAAHRFFECWPEPQDWANESLAERLSAGSAARPVITFLMLHGRLRPGYDYLLSRKLSPLWREIETSPLRAEIDGFLDAAEHLGFTARTRLATGSQVPARLLIQTGKPMRQLTLGDLAEFAAACREREHITGRGANHYLAAISTTQMVLFHLGVVDSPPRSGGPVPYEERLAGVSAPLRAELVGYLERKRATCDRKTVSAMATRLKHFGEFLTQTDPVLTSVRELDRRRHVEPFLASLVDAVSDKDGAPISIGDRNRRVVAVATFLRDITEWGWDAAPSRKVLFRDDIPKLPQVLPRYLPIDADRRLTAALTEHPENELAALALRLQRACGLRIGELLDLELDCVHEIDGNGAWLKVPLGKLATERMVPLDPETLEVIDRVTQIRSHGRPLPHPRYRRPAQFLFTYLGRRLTQQGVRRELDHATEVAGLGHVTSHQLRHTYATALVNAGVSLQALMALLGHQSAEMSLRYGRLFDTTVRTEYERALDLAKQNTPAATAGDMAGRTQLPLTAITGSRDWRDTPLLKSRMAGGFCLRAPAQGACTYANICEHCPSYRSEPSSLPILAAQRVDAEALARDAQQRGWIDEAERHHKLIARLDALIADTETQTG
ncbi:tyrosine-type recombinase/integrase [Ruania alkalisoli]|uniref:Tyrosine-type recombinase/integrase n=1 Tax=Ruania alkalisoli TaxID=2779775 RepID=A0A7M1STC0_9MICO|nr:tyrosine-type recombinase/integrase [Ruania alkalisoli]QOR70818.1 tyrosine-type recombinase/integrase [Ruania alkalisoli]